MQSNIKSKLLFGFFFMKVSKFVEKELKTYLRRVQDTKGKVMTTMILAIEIVMI